MRLLRKEAVELAPGLWIAGIEDTQRSLPDAENTAVRAFRKARRAEAGFLTLCRQLLKGGDLLFENVESAAPERRVVQVHAERGNQFLRRP